MKKLILHIPHTSVNIPILEGYIQDADKIQNELMIPKVNANPI